MSIEIPFSSHVFPLPRTQVVFSGMSELKSQWEAVSTSTKEDRARERQEELAKLRLRLCHVNDT